MATGTGTTTGASARVTAKRAPRPRKQQVRKQLAAKAAPKVGTTVEVRTKPSAKPAQLDPRTIAYAYLGAGELAYVAAREASGKVISIVRNPRDIQSVSGKLSIDVTKAIGDLAARGEKLVSSVKRSAYTKRAMSQTKIARSQVKAAGTSVRKAVDTTTTAAREAVKRVS